MNPPTLREILYPLFGYPFEKFDLIAGICRNYYLDNHLIWEIMKFLLRDRSKMKTFNKNLLVAEAKLYKHLETTYCPPICSHGGYVIRGMIRLPFIHHLIVDKIGTFDGIWYRTYHTATTFRHVIGIRFVPNPGTTNPQFPPEVIEFIVSNWYKVQELVTF